MAKNPQTMRNGANKSEKNTALFEQLKSLEKDWETINKQSKSSRRDLRRCSTGSSEYSIFTSFLEMENSPRGLMSALQHRRSPSDGLVLNVKKSDCAVEEIIRDRRAAIKSGNLKGRQLWGAFEGAADEEIICSDCLDLVQEKVKLSSVCKEDENSVQENAASATENHPRKLSVGSCSGSDCLSEVNQTLEEAKKEEELMVKRVSGNLKGNGGRFMHAMAWFAFVSMLFTFVVISMTCDGKNVHEEDKVIHLVPT